MTTLGTSSILKKSLRELSHASSSLGVMAGPDDRESSSGFRFQSTTSVNVHSSEAAAHRLLATSGVDSAKLARDSRDLDVLMQHGTPFEKSTNMSERSWMPLPIESQETTIKTPSLDIFKLELDQAAAAVRHGKLEEYFQQKHLQLMESVLNRHKEFSMEAAKRETEKRLLEDSDARIKEASHSSTLIHGRALSGVSATFKAHLEQQKQREKLGYPARERAPDALIWNEVAVEPSIYQTPNNDKENKKDPNSTKQLDMGHVMDTEQELAYISSHAPSVAKHLQLLLAQDQPTGIPSFDALISMVESNDKSDGFMDKTTRNAYLNASRLLKHMMDRELIILDSNNKRKSTYPRDYQIVTKPQQVLYRATGALQYLGEQFFDHIVNRVTQVHVNILPRVNGDSEKNKSLPFLVQKYVELELGRDVVARGGNTVLFRCLYYCLRSGDACAANDLLESYLDVDPALRNIISAMANGQSTIHAADTPGSHSALQEPSFVPLSLRKALADQYLRQKARYTNYKENRSHQNDAIDEYQLACLALLSLEEPLITTGTKSIIITIEDYIFAQLWWAINFSSDRDDTGGEKSCSTEIFQLGQNIKQWGPDYFEGTVGWSYALPLFLSQQFQSAIAHLANTVDQGLLVATHLSLALSASGAEVTDFNPGHDSSDVEFLSSLLDAFVQALQSLTPRGALRYLVCIPRNSTDEVQGKNIKTRLYNKLSRLFLTTKAFESLAGHVSVDGSRMPSMGMGGLDKYFTRVEVSDILEFASEESYRDGNAADSAELLMLAERYGSLLSLICRQLSALVTEEHSDINQRTFWRTAAQHFYSIYLENGRSYVVQILEKEGRFSLKKTVFILLQLMDCFDSHRDRHWQRSWDVLNNLELFPRSASEMALKVSSYYELDGEVRDIFHSVILIAMDCLYQEYLTIKTSFAGESPVASTAQLRSSEIRSRAKLLVTFSCLIQYRDSNQTKLRINQMEACMV